MKRLAIMLALIWVLLCPSVHAEGAEKPAFGREFSGEYAAYGDYVTLRYTVRNTLGESIAAVTISDPLVGGIGYIETLAPDEERTFTARVRIIADCLSTPTLSYTLGGQTLTVTAPQKGVTLENAALSAALSEEDANGERRLVLTVTNQGNAPVYGIKAIDQTLGDMGAAVSVLKPGESTRFERTLPGAGSHIVHVSAKSASGQALEIDSNALSAADSADKPAEESGITLSAAFEDGRVLVTIENGTNTRLERLTLNEQTGGETRVLLYLPARSRTQTLWPTTAASGETLFFSLTLPDGTAVSAEPLTLSSNADADEPTAAIPDGVSFRMADDPQTYRNMMLSAGLIILALAAGAWLTAAIKRRRERRRRLKKRQERKKQRQNAPKRTDSRKSEEKKA